MKDKQQMSLALGGSTLVHLILAGGVTTLLAFSRVAPPGNDRFENSMEFLTESTGSVFGDNYYATRELFEPTHAQTVLGGSVWWHWKAGQSGEVEVNVSAEDFKEVVGVYRGAVLETLVEVAARGEEDQEPVRFSAQQGQLYYIAVAGSGEEEVGRISVDIAILDDNENEPDDDELVLLLPEMFVMDELEEEDQPEKLDYVRTRSRDASEKPPEHARLESDNNTLAASEIMPDEQGEEDVPNVRGEDLPFGEVVSSEFTDGDFKDEGELPVTAVQVPAVEITPKTPDASTGPVPAEVATNPAQSQQEDEGLTTDAAAQEELHDTDHEMPADEKASGERIGQADTDELINDKQPDLEVVENHSGKQVTSPGEGALRQVREEKSPAFQTHSPKKQLAGKLSNIGKPSLDIAETPLGHYKKKVDQAVQRSWHRERTARGDFAKYGSLKVRFWVDRSGKIVELKVLRNDSDPVMLDFSISGIRNAILPPVPEELIERTQDERMEFDYEIIIY
ncbi:MAG: hypothetical protein GY899_06145 [Verrucomicrobiaceae bacterium]|nr:hypothetical protein [Verrucomicrobiaceae bacterium]